MGSCKHDRKRGRQRSRKSLNSERGSAGGRRAGPAAAGWSSLTNCSPAVSAWTGTGPLNCCHVSTATVSTPVWRGWSTMSNDRSNVQNVEQSTGELPDPNADSIMSRCAVCSEKAYVNPCAHCDKKCCDTCRDAHCDILKREISRINNQIKRGVHKVEDALSQVERNQTQLKTNADQVVTEIDEIQRRLANALKERTDY